MDMLAVIEALQETGSLTKQKEGERRPVSPSPSFTPPDKIDYEGGVTIVTKPVDPNPEVLCVVFAGSQEFILTYTEIMRGGPMNAFLRAWNEGASKSGRLPRLNMPDSYSPCLFQIMHEYLRGKEAIPLSREHAEMLGKRYSSLEEVYKQLYREARQYGLYALLDRVRAYQKHAGRPGLPPPDRFKVYDAITNCPLREEDLDRLARHTAKRLSRGTSPLRAVIIGATMK